MTLRGLLLLTVLTAVAATACAADWPQWGGPNRDNVSKEKGLLQKWPANGPKLLWTYKDAGIGYSGPTIVGNRLYTAGALGEKEFLYALDLDKTPPAELWKVEIGPIWTDAGNIWGDGPRSSPTVDGDNVYVIGGQGVLVCADTKGKKLWSQDFVKNFGGKVMEHIPPTNWGFCESVLIDGDKVVCCPGGNQGLMMALDKLTGKLLWRTKGLVAEASDGSMVVGEIGGVRQYVQTFYVDANAKKGGCTGIDAKTGNVLWTWTSPRYNIYSITPTPIIVGDTVCLSANQGAGTDLLKITKDAKGDFKVEDEYKPAVQRKTIANTHGGMVLVDGKLYGYSERGGWMCQDLATGKPEWSERKLDIQKSAALTYADGNLYLLTDRGEIALVPATPKGWQENGKFKLPEEAKSRDGNRKTSAEALVWTHPVVANGRLYIRDQELIFCYDVAAPGGAVRQQAK